MVTGEFGGGVSRGGLYRQEGQNSSSNGVEGIFDTFINIYKKKGIFLDEFHFRKLEIYRYRDRD